MLVFKRKRVKNSLLDNTPSGTIGGCSDNGWITTKLFQLFVQHLVKYIGCSKSNEALLILDGHRSHTKNLMLIDFARDNGLVILSILPHATHKLQPLDVSFFKPFKSAFDSLVKM